MAILLLGLAASCAEAPERARSPVRALWVTRWDYLARQDVELIFEHGAEAGFRTIMFQVRGNATVFYPSSLEPWALELGGGDPGYDPLAVALRAAHDRGLELHAWVNVVPAWWGSEPPADPEHVVNAHPDWLWYDQEGKLQAYSQKFYISLNPCLPEVRAHISAVIEELISTYEFDGLHLDYIRFPNEPPASAPGQDFPRDARTLALFAAEERATPDDDPLLWDRWRARQITNLVADIRAVQMRLRPELLLSAAVGPTGEALLRHHQDCGTWLGRGLVDAIFPMNYSADAQRFDTRLEPWRKLAKRAPVVMGLRIDGLDAEELRRRMELAEREFAGWCLFGYSTLWDSPNEIIDRQDSERGRERERWRERLLPLKLKSAWER